MPFVGRSDVDSVTRLLGKAAARDRQATADLLPLIYDELRRLAAGCFAGERPDHTLQPTAPVHKAYLRLVDQKIDWAGARSPPAITQSLQTSPSAAIWTCSKSINSAKTSASYSASKRT